MSRSTPEDRPERPGAPSGGVAGVILAGGLGTRMAAAYPDCPKALVPFRGRPLIEHAIERLRPQVDRLILNANDEPGRFARFGLPVRPDLIANHPGPLAGIHAGMSAAADDGLEWVASIPCDSPFTPFDLVARLARAASAAHADVAVARTPQAWHPVFLLARSDLAKTIAGHLERGQFRVASWIRACAHVEVPFEDERAFINLNSGLDLQAHDSR